jgi:hypothetical protein
MLQTSLRKEVLFRSALRLKTYGQRSRHTGSAETEALRADIRLKGRSLSKHQPSAGARVRDDELT